MAVRKRAGPKSIKEEPSTRATSAQISECSAFLLDTHTFLWFVTGSERLSAMARRVIENPTHSIYVSAASVWEIAIKRHIGKLPETVQFPPTLGGYIQRRGFQPLAMTVEHAEAAGVLPSHHRDPFDRMLIAQAQVDTLILVSNEVLFDAYHVRRVW